VQIVLPLARSNASASNPFSCSSKDTALSFGSGSGAFAAADVRPLRTDAGRSSTSIMSLIAIMQEWPSACSSSRMLPGQECRANTICTRGGHRRNQVKAIGSSSRDVSGS